MPRGRRLSGRCLRVVVSAGKKEAGSMGLRGLTEDRVVRVVHGHEVGVLQEVPGDIFAALEVTFRIS